MCATRKSHCMLSLIQKCTDWIAPVYIGKPTTVFPEVQQHALPGEPLYTFTGIFAPLPEVRRYTFAIAYTKTSNLPRTHTHTHKTRRKCLGLTASGFCLLSCMWVASWVRGEICWSNFYCDFNRGCLSLRGQWTLPEMCKALEKGGPTGRFAWVVFTSVTTNGALKNAAGEVKFVHLKKHIIDLWGWQTQFCVVVVYGFTIPKYQGCIAYWNSYREFGMTMF